MPYIMLSWQECFCCSCTCQWEYSKLVFAPYYFEELYIVHLFLGRCQWLVVLFKPDMLSILTNRSYLGKLIMSIGNSNFRRDKKLFCPSEHFAG